MKFLIDLSFSHRKQAVETMSILFFVSILLAIVQLSIEQKVDQANVDPLKGPTLVSKHRVMPHQTTQMSFRPRRWLPPLPKVDGETTVNPTNEASGVKYIQL